MNAVRNLWTSIKRNPVINAFILAAIGQVLNDYLNNEIGWDNLGVYISTVAIGVIARMFTVPESENRELKDQVSKAIAATSEQFAGWVSPEKQDKQILYYTKKAEALTRAQIESELMDPHFKKGGFND